MRFVPWAMAAFILLLATVLPAAPLDGDLTVEEAAEKAGARAIVLEIFGPEGAMAYDAAMNEIGNTSIPGAEDYIQNLPDRLGACIGTNPYSGVDPDVEVQQNPMKVVVDVPVPTGTGYSVFILFDTISPGLISPICS